VETILIVGGAGYIGCHTTLLLWQHGYKIIVLDDYLNGKYPPLPWAHIIHGNMANTELLNTIFLEHSIKAVIHLAASINIAESVSAPLVYYENNLANTINVLHCMIRHNVHQIVFASTAAVYGMPDTVPIAESATCKPITPYGMSKYMCEQIIQDLHRAYGLQSVILRFFNVAGAHQTEDLSMFYTSKTHLIPLLFHATMSEKPFNIFGTTHQTIDGSCVRDYVHVMDVAQAHLKALIFLKNGGQQLIANIASGHGTSVKEVIKTTEQYLHLPARIIEQQSRSSDPAQLVANIDQAQNTLFWRPERSNISYILETFGRFFLSA